jgi:3-oxoisoapionate kinase
VAEVVFLGDDFTGASDSLATYAKGGWRTRLVLSEAGIVDELDALGLATDLRSVGPDRAAADIARLWPFIEKADPRVLHLKVCSTFDSSPETGSIGAVALDLIARFRPDVVAVIGGQPSLARYCAFGNLFAKGPDGAVHRIDRHPVMSRHPVTPMKEADLRRHLALQGLGDLALVPVTALDDTDSVLEALRAGPVLFDVMSPEDQHQIAATLQRAGGRQLLIGSSAVAEILAAGKDRTAAAATSGLPGSRNALVFAGSRSAVTQTQVARATRFEKLALTPDLLGSAPFLDKAAELVRRGVPVLVHLVPDAEYGFGPGDLADAGSAFVSGLLSRADVGYLGLAGGDTSSRICAALGFDALEFESTLTSGVSICAASHSQDRLDRMRIMLKGGQMGDPALFDKFAEQIGQSA